MKAIYQVTSQLKFEIEAENIKGIFEDLYNINNVFGNSVCGKCKSTDIKPLVQKDGKGRRYFKLECCKCHSQLKMGQHDGDSQTLFPRFTRHETKEVIPNNGWEKWSKDEE